MPADRIRRAMNAGKLWATQQLKGGVELTPASAEEAARRRFRHVGLQHLFIISAIEVLFSAEPSATVRTESVRKEAS